MPQPAELLVPPATALEGEFIQWARSLGHDLDDLAQGKEICTYLEVPTFEEGRTLMSRATPEQRRRRSASFFHPAIAARRPLGQGLHDRGEAFIFADGTFDPADLELGVRLHLPAHVKAVSVAHKVVHSGEVWDVSVRGSVWQLDDIQELYVALNVHTLILEPGASVAVQGNVLAVLCQELIAADDAQIRILPTPFSLDRRVGAAQHGAPGVHGGPGANGVNGRSPELLPSLLGPRLRSPIEQHELDALAGEPGQDGARGGDGRNGGMAKLAEITLRSIEGQITIFAQGGAGGNGGSGGDGGDGGRGGDGAPGCKTFDAKLESGLDGDGGNGGKGGNGGHGGNGGLSSNIYVNTTRQDAHKVARRSLASCAGRGGEPGRGGRGAAKGFDGEPGRQGNHGRSRPGPIIFINEESPQLRVLA